jgi:hypothetical protein
LNGRFVLVDLGAAKLMTGTALGQTGTVIGSAEYVAPEQLRGKAIFASDLYSLGATCVTLLTGMSPFSLFDTSTGSWEWRDYLVQNPVSDSLGQVLDRLLIGPTKQRYGSVDQVLEDLIVKKPELVKGDAIDPRQRARLLETEDPKSKVFLATTIEPWWQRKDLLEAELEIENQPPGEVVGRGDDRKNTPPLDSWWWRQKELSEADAWGQAEVGIETTQPGKVVERRGDRQNTKPLTSVILFLLGVSVAFLSPIGATVIANLNSTPAPEEPPAIDLTGVTPLANIIKPTYSNHIKPVKVFRNIPPFKTVAQTDAGNTLVTGLLSSNGKINLNFLEISSGKTSSVNFQAGLDVKEADYSISVLEDNIFLRASDNVFVRSSSGQTNYQIQLQVFNLKSRSFIYSFAENVGFIFSNPDVNPGLSNISYSLTTNLLKISDNKIVKRKVKLPSTYDRSALSQDVLSPDEKNIFTWNRDYSSQTGSSSIINWSLETGKFKSRLMIPSLISSSNPPQLMRVSQYAGNQFLVATGFGMSLDAGADRRKVLAYLPDFYKDKDTQVIGKKFYGYHNEAIYVFDIAQEKLKYFIPRVGGTVGLAVSSDAKTMVTVENSTEGADSKLMIWDLPTGRLIRSIDTHFSLNYDGIKIFFTSDSKSLIVAAPDITFGDQQLQKSADTPDISIWNVNQLRNP